MGKVKIKTLVFAALIGALSTCSPPPTVAAQSNKAGGEVIVLGNSKEATLYDKIKDKASIITPKVIGERMWDYPKEGEFIPVLVRPLDLGDGWKFDPAMFSDVPYDMGLIGHNHVTSPPLPPEKVAYARYDTRKLPTDLAGNVAGGRIPVINYRVARLINGSRCLSTENFVPRNWNKVPWALRNQVVDPILNVLGYQLPESFTFWCPMQGALDAAVALVRFAPSLYSPKEYHESKALYQEAETYANYGLASSADAILQYRKKKIVPVRHFYNRKDSPLYFIVSAYPHMTRVVPSQTYSPDAPGNFWVPKMTFYFFPVSPSGEVCYFQNATNHEEFKFYNYQAFQYAYLYHGRGGDETAFETLGLTGVHCVSMAYSWIDDYITVRVAFKDGEWKLDEDSAYPIRHRVLHAPEVYRIPQEPFAWIGKLREYKAWPVAPSVHPLDGLIRFYPPLVRWLEKIERGERHVVSDAELSLTLFPYSFAPGYALSPADPKRLAQDFTRPISLTLAEAALACQGISCKLQKDEAQSKAKLLTKSSRAVPWYVPRYEVNTKIEYTRTDSGGGAIYVGEDYVISLKQDIKGRWTGGTLSDYGKGRMYTLSVNPKSGKVASCKLERVSVEDHAPFVMLPIHNTFLVLSEQEQKMTSSPEDIHVGWGWKDIYGFEGYSRISISRGVQAVEVKEMCDAEGDKRVAALLSANAEAFPDLVGKQGQLVEWNPKTRRAVVFVPGAKAEQVVKAYEESAKAINPKVAQPFSPTDYTEEVQWSGVAVRKDGKRNFVNVREYARIHRDGKVENGAFVFVQL